MVGTGFAVGEGEGAELLRLLMNENDTAVV